MKVYVLIQHADCNGEGYWQDTIKAIYQNEADANKALEEAKANEPEDGDYGCVLYIAWSVAVHDLIQ